MYGTVFPNASHTFSSQNTLPLELSVGGAVVTLPEGPSGTANESLHLNNGTLVISTARVDLREFYGDCIVSLDLKTWETSDGSDFELNDRVHVVAEYSTDGINFTRVDLIPVILGGGSVGDPADRLKGFDTGELGIYTRIATALPAGAQTVRLIIDATNNSDSEHFYFDNLQIVIVPEPSSAVLITTSCAGLMIAVARRQRRFHSRPA